MDLSRTIFKNDSYKLVLSVYDRFNDYNEHCYTALLKLYTLDNRLITSEVYSFPRLAVNCDNNTSKAYELFFTHLNTRNKLLNVAFDLYSVAISNKNEAALSL